MYGCKDKSTGRSEGIESWSTHALTQPDWKSKRVKRISWRVEWRERRATFLLKKAKLNLENLTVFVTVEIRRRRLGGWEEEETRVDGDTGSDQRNDLERVELACQIWLLFFSEDYEEEKQDEDNQCLDASARGPKEDCNEDHSDFTQHHHTLPIVSVLLVAFEEEPIPLCHLFIEKLILPFSKQSPSQPRNAYYPEDQPKSSPDCSPE